ncbi:MAG TPA: APC family permease [Acidimicrobiales bacterium]|nr:APC family permease [Acidimicrobiales bacterium]
MAVDTGGPERTVPVEMRVLPRRLALGSIVFIMFFTVSGGAYGLEDVVGSSGAGMAILLIVLTPIVWSVPTALMVAELATAMPVEGGFYVWVKRAMGPFWGFQEGWWSWLTTWVDMAIYPVLFVDYAAYYWGTFESNPLARWLLGMAVIWFFTLLNVRGAKIIGDSSKIFAVIVLAPFALLTVIGLFKGGSHNPFEPFTLPGQDIKSALTLGLFVVMWNYLGWDGLSTVAGEMENPRRDYPRSLVISIPLITACYLLPVMVGLWVVGTTQVEWTAGAWTTIAEIVGGKWLGSLMSAAALVSAAGLFSALLLSVSRVPFVMGRDGYLPKVLMRTHRTYGTPWVALVISSAIYSIFILGPFQSLVVVDVMIYAGALALEFVALVVLRIRAPQMDRPYRIPGGWPTLILVCLGPAVILYVAISGQIDDSGLASSVGLALLFMASGPILYPVVSWWRKRSGHAIDVLDELAEVNPSTEEVGQ